MAAAQALVDDLLAMARRTSAPQISTPCLNHKGKVSFYAFTNTRDFLSCGIHTDGVHVNTSSQ